MKNFTSVIGIVLLVAIVVIVGVLAYHTMYGESFAARSRSGSLINKTMPMYPGEKTYPESSLDKTAGTSGGMQVAPLTGTETPESLMGELKATEDDGGTSELQNLKQQTSQL